MDAPHNPFTPVFGRDPAYFAGREQILDDVVRALDVGNNDPNLTSIFVGARGTGKTALLSRLASEATKRGWIAVSVTAIPGMLEDIIQRIHEEASHLIGKSESRKITSLEIAPLGSIGWENVPEDALNWRSRMNILFEQLAETETGILITVDEVDPNLDEMIELATTYQHFIREGKKVALLMAGLPHNVSRLRSGKHTSFLRRAFRQELGAISPEDVHEGYRMTLEGNGKTIDPIALDAAVRATKGFPFMFQLVGFRMWNASTTGQITEENVKVGVELAQSDLRRQVFDSTYSDLSKSDLLFLKAMLEDESESSLSDISDRLGKPSGHVSTYKKRMLEAGVIEEGLRKGIRFSLPGFRDYLSEMLSTEDALQ